MSRFLLLSAASAVSLSLGVTANAQESESRQDTVVVTTPGPDRAADELITSATVLDREELLEGLYSTLGDTLDRQPGVASTFYGQGASRPVLRGLGAERVQVLTNGLGVIDVSAASPDHQVTADGIDADKIEIVRGPAALAYGGQAIGGVVNVIDGLIVEELPEEPFSADLFGAYNTVNEGTELAGKGQFTTGPFVVSFSASQRDFDNYEIPGFAESAFQMAAEEAEGGEEGEEEEEVSGTQENSFVETQTLAAGLSWVGDNAFFGVAIREQTSEYGLPGGHEHGHEEGEEEGEEEEEEENPFIDLEQTRIDLRGGVTLGDGFITDITASASIVDYEHTEFEAPGEAGTVFDTEGYEGRIEAGTEFGDIVGAVGLQFLDKEFSAVGEEAFITPTDTQSYAVFTYQTLEFDSGAGIEGGLRLENTELDNVQFGQRRYTLASASAGVHQHLDNGWFLGAQLAYTQRAPNESELFAFGPHLATNQFEVGGEFLEKEKGLNLDLTARWTGENVRIGANLFATDFDGFIYLTPGTAFIDGAITDEGDGLPVFIFEQDSAVFRGGEIYAGLTLDEGPAGADWDFTAGVDIVDAELGDGGNVPLVPPLTFNAGASAEWGAFEVGANLTWADEQNDAGAGQFETDGYTLIDLRAELDISDFGIGSDGTEVFIEARNVTDEEVRFATSVLKDVAPAPGQNIRAGVRLSF
ncbi:MAG: TonB-dependent receptor [Pseudomonadota bacterium]